MRRLRAAVGAACAAVGLAGAVSAQFGPTGGGVPAVMPGQVVGTGFNLSPVGTQQPAAAPNAGVPVGNPLMRPYDPSKPYDVFKGTNIDPKSVVAPVQGLGGTQTQNLFQRLYEKLGTTTGFIKAPVAPVTRTYTPGISRRNRERAMDRGWRRD